MTPFSDDLATLHTPEVSGRTREYAASDWTVSTVECVSCPGCAFTFDACHVTQVTGQYDCPVCGATSVDGGAA